MYDEEMATSVKRRCAAHSAVKEVISSQVRHTADGQEVMQVSKEQPLNPVYARHRDELEVRGIKNKLREKKTQARVCTVP